MPGLDSTTATLIGGLADHYGEVSRLGDGAEGGALAATERATGRRVVLKRVPAEQSRSVRFAFEVLRRAGSPHLPAPRALVTADDGAGWMVILTPEDWDDVKAGLTPGTDVSGPYEAKMDAEGFGGCEGVTRTRSAR